MAGMSAPTPEILNDRYRLDEVIGEGGMAVVWRAHDTALDRTVAVKVLRDQYARDPEFLTRFSSEARSAAALNHPGIVSVHDVGEDDGRHYLVMEHVPGRDLKSLISDDAPLSPQIAVDIAIALAEAVSAAHAVGLVHRDIKPQNILVCADGRMKVGDFGIARAQSAAGITEPGLVMGTVHYIAPEQAAGEAATTASDVYSLGVVLYEMLSGEVPFDADSKVGVAMKIMNDEPVPLEVRNPRVPSVLAGIIQRAMSKDPERRYQDAAALAEALAGFARWSEQLTGGLPIDDSVPRGEADRQVTPPRRPTTELPEEHEGPLLDRTGLLLAAIALIALAGLIPLWIAVLARADASSAPPATAVPGGASVEGATSGALAEPALEPVLVPDLVGMEEAAATKLLEGLGLGVTTPSEASSTVPEGEVMRQVPAPGEELLPGAVVELTVSREPSIEVPAVSGDYDTVAAALLALDLEPVYRPIWSGSSGEVGVVVGLDPPPGSRLPRHSPVHVAVNAGPWLGLGVDYEDNIHLRSIELATDQVPPGGTVSFVAQWEAVGTIEGDYATRASLETLDGEPIAQAELPLADRAANTWQEGERLTGGRYNLTVDPATPPADYALWFEVYPVGSPDEQLAVRSRGMASRLVGGRIRLRLIEVK